MPYSPIALCKTLTWSTYNFFNFLKTVSKDSETAFYHLLTLGSFYSPSNIGPYIRDPKIGQKIRFLKYSQAIHHLICFYGDWEKQYVIRQWCWYRMLCTVSTNFTRNRSNSTMQLFQWEIFLYIIWKITLSQWLLLRVVIAFVNLIETSVISIMQMKYLIGWNAKGGFLILYLIFSAHRLERRAKKCFGLFIINTLRTQRKSYMYCISGST